MKTEKEEPSLARPGDEAFEALLDREGMPLRSAGSIEFLVDGPPYFSALFQAIDEANERVDVQTYIFDNDVFAVRVADRLKEKSRDVPVRVYFDTTGSMAAGNKDPEGAPIPQGEKPSNMASYLKRDSQVEVRTTFNPYFVADHTKLQLFDGRVAFLGGMNVGAEYQYTWHDLMARVEGPVVAELSQIFEDHWRDESWLSEFRLGRSSSSRRHSPTPVAAPAGGYAPVRVLRTDISEGKREILKATLAAIRCARKRVWIETPYFSSDDVTRELGKAARRGVDVRVILPSTPDSKLLKKVNAEEMEALLKTRAKVYEYPGMTHLKATVCDDWMTFGSANYDTLSMRINQELNLATSDKATVERFVRAVFEPDFRASKRLTLEAARGKGGAFAELLGDQM